jgi:hypothetical protein
MTGGINNRECRATHPSISFNTPIEASLEPLKFFECICEGGRYLGGRFAVQPLWLDEPGTSGRISERAIKVPSDLGMVVWTLPTCGVSSCNRQPSESDVIHDHVRLRQHQIVAVACIVVRILTGHVQHAGTTVGGETVGGSSCSSELSAGGDSAEMISDGCSDANGKILIKGIGENLLPTAESWRLWRPGSPVAAPDTGDSHADLLRHLIPGQALITKLQDLLRGCGMSGSTARTHGDASALELFADNAPMNTHLGTDLA